MSTTPQQPAQQLLVSAAAPQHAAAQHAATQQFVAVKGGHVIAVSPQKQSAGPAASGMTQNKVCTVDACTIRLLYVPYLCQNYISHDAPPIFPSRWLESLLAQPCSLL